MLARCETGEACAQGCQCPWCSPERTIDALGACLRQVKARDLPAGVGLRLAKIVSPRKHEIGEPCFLARLAKGRVQRVFSHLDASPGKVPVTKRAEEEQSRTLRDASQHDDPGGAFAVRAGVRQSRSSEDAIANVRVANRRPAHCMRLQRRGSVLRSRRRSAASVQVAGHAPSPRSQAGGRPEYAWRCRGRR